MSQNVIITLTMCLFKSLRNLHGRKTDSNSSKDTQEGKASSKMCWSNTENLKQSEWAQQQSGMWCTHPTGPYFFSLKILGGFSIDCAK